MEKIYEVTMDVRQKSEIPLEWVPHTFRVFGKTPDGAKVRALIEATHPFPLDGWDYDHLNATVVELSLEQIGRELEERRNQIMAEQPAKLQKVRDDLAKIGVILPKTE